MRIKVYFDIAYELEMIDEAYTFRIPTTLNPLYKDWKTLMENRDKIFLKDSPLEKMVVNNSEKNRKRKFKTFQEIEYDNPWNISIKINGIQNINNFSFDSTHILEEKFYENNTICLELSTKAKQNPT